MVNGLGVLGWGVGGIEAEAAMLGQPVSMLIPQVVGFRLDGELPEGSTATDLVLTITRCCASTAWSASSSSSTGRASARVPLANRATIGNMSPGVRLDLRDLPDRRRRRCATCASPAARTSRSRWSRRTPRSRGSGTTRTAEPAYSETLELDLSTVVPSLAGPKRPQDRVPLADAKQAFRAALADYADADGIQSAVDEGSRRDVPGQRPGRGRRRNGPSCRRRSHPAPPRGRASSPTTVTLEDGTETELDHGAVVIAAITSCTNTSNPSVMIGAALLAKKAVERGPAEPSRG